MRRALVLLLAAGPIAAALMACSSSGSGTSTATSAPVPSAANGSPATGDTSGSGVPGSLLGSTPAGTFALTSSAFGDGAAIPLRYACAPQGGAAASPPLAWTGTPAAATTLVLVVHDPDAPIAGGFTHLVTSFPATTTAVADGENTTAGSPMARWVGPCPPSGTHHYGFTLYAFGPDVIVPAIADKAAIDALAPKALATAQLTGLFSKQ